MNRWRGLAENVAESLTRGTRVVVVGRLQYRSWETQEGEKRSAGRDRGRRGRSEPEVGDAKHRAQTRSGGAATSGCDWGERSAPRRRDRSGGDTTGCRVKRSEAGAPQAEKDEKAWQKKRKRKVCIFCKDQVDYVDYKDVVMLRKFVSERGKIRARRVSGNCVQHQRDVATAVKNAREMALLPYSSAMKIILQKPVDKLGEPGDIVEVADGYARNYLVPQRDGRQGDEGRA